MNNNNPSQSTILAFDDEILNLELLKFILNDSSYKLICSTNGENALELIEENQPDLILLDIMMPKITGFEVCERIKAVKKYKSIPVIFITGLAKIDDKVKGFELGGVDYITKPFNEKELKARVKTHLELVRSKRKIELQAQGLKDNNLLKDKMFSIIGHDLRSPLSSAKLKLDFIRRGIINPKADNFTDETVYELLKTMDESLDLLGNLLGWAKSESGVLKVLPEYINVSELIDRTLRLLKMNIENKNIIIEKEIPEELSVFADQNMVTTVIRNLLSNAVKFTPEAGKITFKYTENEDIVSFSIVDSGVGISKEDIRKILNPNEHFSKKGTNDEPGTGLGLVLCQDFIKKNNGTLDIKSEINVGSAFIITLPKHESDSVKIAG